MSNRDYQISPVEMKNTNQRKGFAKWIVFIVIAFILGVAIGSVALGESESVRTTNTFDSIYDIMAEKWYWGKDVDNLEQALMDKAIDGMVSFEQDPYTEYMDPQESDAFIQSLNNEMVGIGIQYQFINKKIIVRGVIAGSPAESYGIKVGDFITAVDGIDLSTKEDTDIVDMIGGKEGTKVVLTILREGEVFDLSVVRGTIYTSVNSSIVDNNIGYIELNSFSSGTAKELKEDLDQFRSAGVTKLLIDCRNNGGGYLDTLRDISSFFMDEDKVVLIETFKDGREEEIKTTGGKYAFEDIVILINENSASCTEVFAAAMREQNGTTLVGTTSFGKGTVQISMPFLDGSMLKYTEAQWLTPNRDSIHGVGVTPDYEVELDEALYLSLALLEFPSGVESYKFDQVSEIIGAAQMMLDYLGYDVSREDGYFDESTLNALHQFESDNHLNTQDDIDNALLSEIFAATFRRFDGQKEYDAQYQKALEVLNGQ